MLHAFTKIDEELFEELEEILIMGDVGAPTAGRICDELRRKVKEQMCIRDRPKSILKEHKDCSMAEGMRQLAAGEGDAFVSAGSTGALIMGCLLYTSRP